MRGTPLGSLWLTRRCLISLFGHGPLLCPRYPIFLDMRFASQPNRESLRRATPAVHAGDTLNTHGLGCSRGGGSLVQNLYRLLDIHHAKKQQGCIRTRLNSAVSIVDVDLGFAEP